MQRVPCSSLAPRQVHVYEEPLPIAGQKAPWVYVQPNGTLFMLGEYGGIGLGVPGHEWVPGRCFSYIRASSPDDLMRRYEGFVANLRIYRSFALSIAIYTQLADVELECNGFYTFDRVPKLNTSQRAHVAALNRELIRHANPSRPSPARPSHHLTGARMLWAALASLLGSLAIVLRIVAHASQGVTRQATG